MEHTEKSKFVWVTAFTGQVVKIPLQGDMKRANILQRLLNAGISVDQLDNLVFSTIEPEPIGFSRSTFPTRSQVEAALDQPFPPMPHPPSPSDYPPIWSDIWFRNYTPLNTLRQNKIAFSMLKPDGTRVNLWGYNDGQYNIQSQLKEIQDGKVGLYYAVAWKLKGRQVLSPGSTYEDQYLISHGMSSTTQASLSATLSSSGLGLSANLSATFGQQFDINTTETYRETVTFKGVDDNTTVVCLWQLVDLFYIARLNSAGGYELAESYNVTIKDKNDIIDYRADPLFFGNSEKRANGGKIITNLTHPTSFVEAVPTLFPISNS